MGSWVSWDHERGNTLTIIQFKLNKKMKRRKNWEKNIEKMSNFQKSKFQVSEYCCAMAIILSSIPRPIAIKSAKSLYTAKQEIKKYCSTLPIWNAFIVCAAKTMLSIFGVIPKLSHL